MVIPPSASLGQTNAPLAPQTAEIYFCPSRLCLPLSGKLMNSAHLARSLSSFNPLEILAQRLTRYASPLRVRDLSFPK